MLDIIVCVKQVPDAHHAAIDPRDGTLIRESVRNIMNPDDLHALEMALSLRDACGGGITVITMGPPQAEDVLVEAYAMGADECILITDPRFAGSDSYVTSKVLARAIRRLGRHDVIVTGVETIDGNTSSVSYQLSEIFGIPAITQIHKIDISGGHAVIERLFGHEYQKIGVDLPVILSVSKDTNHVRFPSLASIQASFEKPVARLTMEDIGGDAAEYGVKGSPTVVVKSESFAHRRKQEIITGSLDEKVDALVHTLKKYNIIQS